MATITTTATATQAPGEDAGFDEAPDRPDTPWGLTGPPVWADIH